ncbi:hypothetical protein D3C73_693890 [compost metagenome]
MFRSPQQQAYAWTPHLREHIQVILQAHIALYRTVADEDNISRAASAYRNLWDFFEEIHRLFSFLPPTFPGYRVH